jgi:hypothetical protein
MTLTPTGEDEEDHAAIVVRKTPPFGTRCCNVFVGLSLLYVPTTAAGLIANGNVTAPIRDPYLAVMDLLILALSIPLVLVFAAVHAYAPASKKTLSLSAFAFAVLAAGVTVCVHFLLLTVGRQADENTLPGYTLLFAWKWPSAVYALDIAAWDLCLGVALLLAAATFVGPGLTLWVKRGLVLSGVLCLGGLLGAAVGNMQVRNIGVVGYALVLPVALLLMGRVFAAHPRSGTSTSADQLDQLRVDLIRT